MSAPKISPDSVAAKLAGHLATIASTEACFDHPLVMRNSDSLDFHEVSAAGMRQALLAAYNLGLQHAGFGEAKVADARIVAALSAKLEG